MSRSRVLGIAAVAALVLAVAAAAIQLANLQHHAVPPNGYYEAKLEGNLLKVIDPRTGKVICQMVLRFVNLTVVRAEIKLEGNLSLVNSSAVSVGRHVIKPAIIRLTVPISGVLPPSSSSVYGPYPRAMDLQIQLSWSPASYVCVGYVDASTGSGPATCTYGTSVSADFPVNSSEIIYAIVANGGSITITYNSTLVLYNNVTLYFN
ncbi:MAG: hypothetical protein AT715_07230 [Thermoproteus sp. JCHS_4]|jgi:hypothetical protein|nr:MAG: hypothetical protein AT715_07230 [Thermoproteus sp. JCHS_4]